MELNRKAIGAEDKCLKLQMMARWKTGAIAAGFDGLTDAILPVAEIAATRRLDWRRALDHIVMELKKLCKKPCDQLN